MLTRINGELTFYPYEVEWIDNDDITRVQWALPNKEWWEEYAEKWLGGPERIKFIDKTDTFSELKMERVSLVLANANSIGREFDASCVEFIESGIAPTIINHPLSHIGVINELNYLRMTLPPLKAEHDQLKLKYDRLVQFLETELGKQIPQ